MAVIIMMVLHTVAEETISSSQLSGIATISLTVPEPSKRPPGHWSLSVCQYQARGSAEQIQEGVQQKL